MRRIIVLFFAVLVLWLSSDWKLIQAQEAYRIGSGSIVDLTLATITGTSDDIPEGATNKYFTDARFDTRLATKTTDDLTEGSNLYFTNARVDTQLDTAQTITGAWTFSNPILAPDGTASLPACSFTSDPDTGIFLEAAGDLRVSVGGTTRWFFTGDDLKAASASACAIRGVAASATVPNLIPRRTDLNTGIGSAGADQLSLITGGVERIDIDPSGNVGLSTSTFGTNFAGGLAMKNGTANTTDVTDQWHLYGADESVGNSCPHFRTENGSVIKLYKEAALTSGDATAIDATYDSVEQGVLNNVRTRLDEIEDALQAQGLLG